MNKELKFPLGTVKVARLSHVLQAYELVKDNPAHCLQIDFDEFQKGTVCIYPNGIAILPENKDGFFIQFEKNIPFTLCSETSKGE